MLSIRLAHIFLGIAIILAVFVLLRSTTRSVAIIGVTLVLLATDPAFIFTFRTQAHITTFPICFTLLGLYSLHQNRTSVNSIAAGALLGLSTWGYFIYAFMLPGFAAFILLDKSRADKLKHVIALMVGFALGLTPYVWGYALFFSDLGLSGVQWLQDALRRPTDFNVSPAGRAALVIQHAWSAVTTDWHWSTMWGLPRLDFGQAIKTGLLLLMPVLALAFSRSSDGSARALQLIGLTAVSFVLMAMLLSVAMFFTPGGALLGGHHFTLLVPLLYVLAGISAELLMRRVSRPISYQYAIPPAVALIAANILSSQAVVSKLQIHGGAGFYSGIISDYPQRIFTRGDKTPHIFVDWGAELQFIYLTQGRIPVYGAFTPPSSQDVCRFESIKVVTLGQAAEQRESTALQKLGLTLQQTEMLLDTHSGFVFRVATTTPSTGICRR